MTLSISRLATGIAVATMAVQAPAFAHHPTGGQTPLTFFHGFLSGLGHPVIGLDHLAAIVGVGILAALARRGVVPVFAFSLAVIAGVVVHLAKIDVPASELLVGLSTLAIGGLVVSRRALGLAVAAVLFAVAGVFHGYTLGESIVGAEASPLVAYLAGLLLVQTAIGCSVFVAASNLARWPVALRTAGLTVVGLLVALAGGVTAAYAAGLVG